MNVSEGQYESGQMTFSAAQQRPVDLSFLREALGDFEEPEITQVDVRVTGTVATSATVTFTADDAAKLVQEFALSDKGGQRADFDGLGMRLAAQIELGDQLEQPATQATSLTDTAYEMILPVVFNVDKSERGRDYCPHVKEFLPENGGKCKLKMAATNPITGVTFSAGTYEIIVHVVEGRTREPGARLCWQRHDIVATDGRYDVQGSLRAAVGYAPHATAGYAAWSATTYAEIDSESLDYHDQYTHELRAKYVRESHVASDDVIKAKNALAIVTPKRQQSIGKMADLAQLHVKFPAAAPSSSQMLICAITDRVKANSAKILRIPVAELGKGTAMIQTPKGKKPLTSVPAFLRGRLPLRVA